MAELLSKEDQDIVLIDENPEKLANIANSFDLMTLNVHPTSINGLREAGTNKADLFIAVTPDETKNMTCCMLASAMGAQKTVARIDNDEYLLPQHSEFFKKMGINSMIYPELLAAGEITEALKRSWVRQWWEVHDGALIMLGIKLRETAVIVIKYISGYSGTYYRVGSEVEVDASGAGSSSVLANMPRRSSPVPWSPAAPFKLSSQSASVPSNPWATAMA